MKAIYIESPYKIGIKDIELPERKQGEALIKVYSLGICGSDITAYKGTNPTMTYPRIIGHEISGEVLEIEENKENIKVGDRVVLEPCYYCGTCYPCSLGLTNNCESLNILGVRMEGGMVEKISHPIKYLHKIPGGVSWEEAAMVEPLTISLHAVKRGSVRSNEHVVIVGAGSIGILAAKICIAYGAVPILIDTIDERLNLAKKEGILNIINATKINEVKKIKELTKNRMAEVVIECSGSNSGVRGTIDFCANGGRIVFVGWPKADIVYPVALILKKEVNLFGSRCSKYSDFKEAIELISSGKVNLKPLITKSIKLGEIPETIIEISNNPGNYLKVVAII